MGERNFNTDIAELRNYNYSWSRLLSLCYAGETGTKRERNQEKNQDGY